MKYLFESFVIPTLPHHNFFRFKQLIKRFGRQILWNCVLKKTNDFRPSSQIKINRQIQIVRSLQQVERIFKPIKLEIRVFGEFVVKRVRTTANMWRAINSCQCKRSYDGITASFGGEEISVFGLGFSRFRKKR